MKRSEFKELISKSESDLNKLILQYRQDLSKAAIGIKSTKSKKGNSSGENRKSIARILTILRQKQSSKL